MKQKIMVSIICNAYNHEMYIQDALDSFINQKTNFEYEVLVHDDASTDRTAQIIREYEHKYPDLVKPFYQTENQYSKGIAIDHAFQYPRAKGKYYALCEGDDYWCDPDKIQKQVDALELHPEVDICAHGAFLVDSDTKKTIKEIVPSSTDAVLSVEQVVLGGGGYVATNSLMFRRELQDNVPEFREHLPIDYALQIHGSLRGGMLYLKDKMSCYRYMAKGSWTTRTKASRQHQISWRESIVTLLQELNEYTTPNYTDAISLAMLRQKFGILELTGEYSQMRKEPYKQIYHQLSLRRKAKLLIKEVLQSIHKR